MFMAFNKKKPIDRKGKLRSSDGKNEKFNSGGIRMLFSFVPVEEKPIDT
jgi:hypothetical protein